MLCSPPTTRGTAPAKAKLKAALPELKGAQDADLSLLRGTSVRYLPHILVLRCPISPSSCIPHRDSAGVHFLGKEPTKPGCADARISLTAPQSAATARQ